jgi:hypothetical protein
MPLSSSPVAGGGRHKTGVRQPCGGSIVSWLHNLIQKSSWELEASRKTIFQFGQSVTQVLSNNPIQTWEADAWARGLRLGLIRLEGYFFRVGSGKRSSLSFFIRNDRDLYVGLRRESVTQAATYVSLITDYGYPRTQVRFESRWMDVAVYGEDGKALIYAENKANQKTLEKLCSRLSTEFINGIPVKSEASRVERKAESRSTLYALRPTFVDDAVMKAHHIWKNKPRYFWGVCPKERKAYRVRYAASGFSLQPIETMVPAEGLLV